MERLEVAPIRGGTGVEKGQNKPIVCTDRRNGYWTIETGPIRVRGQCVLVRVRNISIYEHDINRT